MKKNNLRDAPGRAFLAAREALFPSYCPICGDYLLYAHEAEACICDKCAERFITEADESGEKCSVCGKPLISEHLICTLCRTREGWPLDGCTVLYPYTGVYAKALIAYKFHSHRNLKVFFSEKLLRCGDSLPGMEGAVWVPVPPRGGKIKKTGWDQVEEMAKLMQKKAPVARVLKRLASLTQKKLSAADREKNLQGKIVVTGVPPEKIILFDDVYTTGSTLSACASALKSAGAQKVYGVCLYYA
jgi:ComF family protein